MKKTMVSLIGSLILIGLFPYNNLNFKQQNNNALETNNQIDLTNIKGQMIDLELGYYHSGVTVDTDSNGTADTLYMWGYNGGGQLGIGNKTDQFSPVKVNYDWGGDIVNLSLGDSHSGVTVDTDSNGTADTLYMWGYNTAGQLGNGTTTTSLTPIKINYDWGGDIVDLKLGLVDSGVSIDTNADGKADTLYMWGYDLYGQLGNGQSGIGKIFSTPQLVTPKNGWGGNIVDFDAFGFNSGAIVDTNNDNYADTLYMWGNDFYGQLGMGKVGHKSIPTKVDFDWNGDIINLAVGGGFAGVIVDTNANHKADTLYMWGDDEHGQLGNGLSGVFNWFSTPQLISYKNGWGGNIVDFSLGWTHTAITLDTNNDNNADTLYMWGANNFAQLGLGYSGSDDQTTPIEVSFNSNDNFIDLSLGADNTGVLIDNDGDGTADDLYMWGRNDKGQIGVGYNSLPPVNLPTKIN